MTQLNATVRLMHACSECEEVIGACDICHGDYFSADDELECNDGQHYCRACSEENEKQP